MNIRRAILALGAACALSFGLLLAASQANAATVTINPRANAVEAGQVLAAPDGSVFTIIVYDAGLEAGQKSVTHTFQTGDTLRQTANKIVQAINADSELQAIGVTATLQNGANYTIVSTSTNGTLYKQTTTGGGSNRLAIQQTLTIGGTVTVDDKLTLTIFDAGLVGGKEAVVYKPNTGDALADIVIKLRNKINNSTALAALGITAKVSTADANTLLIESPTFDATEKFTSYSAKVKAGGTETLTLGNFWGTNGAQSISVAGPVAVGETVQFTVYNIDLPDEQKTVSYQVQSGDNLNKIRCGLRTEVNNDADLAEIGVHAICGGGVLTLNSTSNRPTTTWEKPLVSCRPVINIPNKWPAANQAKICGSATDVNAQIMRDTLEALADVVSPGGFEAVSAAAKLSLNNQLAFYFYANHDEYYESGDIPFFHPTGGPIAAAVKASNPLDPNIGTLALILGYSRGASAAGYSAIFETSRDETHSIPGSGIPGAYIAHQTAHEAGHHLNAWNGVNLSSSAEYQTAWQRDIQHLNKIPPCGFDASDGQNVDANGNYIGGYYASSATGLPDPSQPPRLSGLFSGAKDYTGAYICDNAHGAQDGFGPNLQGPYAGKTNKEIIGLAYPRFAPPSGHPLDDYPLSELFPEQYADLVAFTDLKNNSGQTASDSECAQFNMCSSRIFHLRQDFAPAEFTSFGGIFACTYLYVKTQMQENRAPNAEELGTHGIIVPDKRDSDPFGVLWGFGATTYFCDGSTDHGNYGFGS